MGPKAAAVGGIMARVTETKEVKLDDLSLAADSGWRDVDCDMVAQLKEKLQAGEWGQTTLGNPSVVCEQKEPLTASDGKFCLNNGKHIITALVQLNSLLEEEGLLAKQPGDMDIDSLPDDFAWFVPPFREVFTQGVRVDFVEYPVGTTASTRAAVQCLAHEAEMNKFQESTIMDKANTARRVCAEVGGSWEKARAQLLDILGSTKRNTVSRWIIIARGVDEEVLSYVKRQKTVPQKYITENKYLVGTGPDKRSRLKPENAIAAFALVFEKFEPGLKPPPATEFILQYCWPMKIVEQWITSMENKFGATATKFPAWQRVCQNLRKERGRVDTLNIIKDKDQLHGRGNVGGIEECRQVVMEMERMKAGTVPGISPPPAETKPNEWPLCLPGFSPHGGEGAGAAAAPAASDEPDTLGDEIFGDDEEAEDPSWVKAQALADAELTHIAIHDNARSWKDDLRARVFQDSRAAVIIDAVTSKTKVLHELVSLAVCFPQNASIMIPVGQRFNVLASVLTALQSVLPKRPSFVVQLCNSSTQSERTRGNYVILIPSDRDQQAPTTLTITGCKAQSSEGLRLRCACATCPWRPKEETEEEEDEKNKKPEDEEEKKNKKKAHYPDMHISGDDTEVNAEDFDVFEEEESDDEPEPQASGSGLGDAEDAKVLNIFPFARPVAWYKKLITELLKGTNCTHLLVLARTGHPSALVAGRELRLEVIALQLGISPHTRGHADKLLKELLTAKARAEVKSPGDNQRKRPLASGDIQFIVVEAPAEQPIRLCDVEPNPDSSWRAGLNRFPEDLAEKSVASISKDLLTYDLGVWRTPEGEMCLHTNKPWRELDTVCPLTGLVFDSLSKVKAVLAKHEDLRERVVRVDNVLDAEGVASSVYVVLTGLGRYLRHYLGIRRGGAHVQIVVNVASGANDGLLALKVKTRNQRGIAPKSPLVLNFGQQYDFTFEEQPTPKKFKGVLDAHFDKAREAAGISPPGVSPQTDEGDKGDKEKADQEKADKEKADKEKADKEKADKEKADKEKADKEKADKQKAANENADMTELGAVTGGHRCLWDGTGIKVNIAAGVASNKKIPPKTVLALTKEGKITSAGSGTPWAFESGSDFVLDAARCEKPEGGSGQRLSILWRHSWTGWGPPASLSMLGPWRRSRVAGS